MTPVPSYLFCPFTNFSIPIFELISRVRDHSY